LTISTGHTFAVQLLDERTGLSIPNGVRSKPADIEHTREAELLHIVPFRREHAFNFESINRHGLTSDRHLRGYWRRVKDGIGPIRTWQLVYGLTWALITLVIGEREHDFKVSILFGDDMQKQALSTQQAPHIRKPRRYCVLNIGELNQEGLAFNR